ncbi:MAG: hypothetical protein A4E63_02944 [Syntrophorhabdus sp. PtaU1.Bin050]|nr:MAG: hypothetical protein A4E63_02944 [Syntrophorhabdus sp. PtaU1.Bin050]
MKRKIILSVIAMAIVLGSVSVGHAVCTVTGGISNVTVPASGAITVYVYTGALTNYYFYVLTAYTSPNLYAAIRSAAGSSSRRVTITGNAATCPTSGSLRYGGYVTTVTVYP